MKFRNENPLKQLLYAPRLLILFFFLKYVGKSEEGLLEQESMLRNGNPQN
ncbi:hypothetical protein TSAR_006822 [Trichomalopsis sarcophagae]|uniref:Uncharacterized protein n=1 Tax=Trichomalopsis sarcophagae TaxID=543379 RepID=A0A232F359_9HYME|nr:hypothetical protein TSAR_006822 [Trichomalopsis sarcophagae]